MTQYIIKKLDVGTLLAFKSFCDKISVDFSDGVEVLVSKYVSLLLDPVIDNNLKRLF